jgi:CDGSH-type Zn-finger protein
MKKGKPAGNAPQMVELESEKTYAWCSCGQSTNQPLCSGAHQGSEFKPKVFKAEESKTAALCMCKQTKNPPYCDGSHMSLA